MHLSPQMVLVGNNQKIVKRRFRRPVVCVADHHETGAINAKLQFKFTPYNVRTVNQCVRSGDKLRIDKSMVLNIIILKTFVRTVAHATHHRLCR